MTTRVEVRNNGVRGAGFERYVVTTNARMSGNRIASFTISRDLTDPETAAFTEFQLTHR